jgi:hypothetical protein
LVKKRTGVKAGDSVLVDRPSGGPDKQMAVDEPVLGDGCLNFRSCALAGRRISCLSFAITHYKKILRRIVGRNSFSEVEIKAPGILVWSGINSSWVNFIRRKDR